MPILKNHRFVLILLFAIMAGSLTGLYLGPSASKLKPLGEIFLNLIFTSVIPLVFFSIASAIAEIRETQTLYKITCMMLIVFFLTSLFAALFMLVCVKLFPMGQHLLIPLAAAARPQTINIAEQAVSMLTVSNFIQLFSRENMLALIIFSALVGLATTSIKEQGAAFATLLLAGRNVSMKLVSIVMLLAPIGFFAFFADLIGGMGANLLHAYARIALIYYLAAMVFFFISANLYAFIAARQQGIKSFWQNIFVPAVTAFATCSSAASIPANLEAAESIGVPKEIAELSIPLGGVLHKDGSVLGGMIKIAFLFGLFHLPFTGASTLTLAILISILVGTVMGAIPSGGMIGEMLIISVYGFPPQALMIIAVISMLIDPPATLISVTSNTLCSMLVARWIKGKSWLAQQIER
ncbi:MAG: dicarboxylate symporter family protein [Gammaproteobacteria bacterium]|jgi:Na+/H+-dicarboxylate symporter|nr:dicarboxylate symporter family protein [Gammaproteobacteria bacterium]